MFQLPRLRFQVWRLPCFMVRVMVELFQLQVGCHHLLLPDVSWHLSFFSLTTLKKRACERRGTIQDVPGLWTILFFPSVRAWITVPQALRYKRITWDLDKMQIHVQQPWRSAFLMSSRKTLALLGGEGLAGNSRCCLRDGLLLHCQ
ncbi:uncharacterized protein LOC126929225 [Macaca thibetana thibetana]|uniref:uncharacterized protein LOC126929225 n=1 Tax=Macaca thibetana thibetana TaxID=257877 RepID=UPI0021BCE2C8|nr:uncharacterized protein LOC126929225 [Macaca thibetana thibetana]